MTSSRSRASGSRRHVRGAGTLLRHYYDLADAEDLLARNVADLYGAIMAHWQTAQKFVPGTARVRVYNPKLEEHGWHSDHTIIEIVNDDMPFLVDSITMEINRLGLTLHSTIHPVFNICRDAKGTILRVGLGGRNDADPAGNTTCRLESFMHFEVDRTGEGARLETLRTGIARILGDVRAAVEDWPRMQQVAEDTVASMGRAPDAASRNRWRPAPSSNGCSTTISPSSASATTSWCRATASTSCAACRARARASCAKRCAIRARTT